MTTCRHCDSLLPETATARAIFCSKKCKELDRTRRRQEAVAVLRVGRVCAHCGASMDLLKWGRAITCSLECSWKLQNKKRAAAAKVARRAAFDPKCERCGEEIPRERRVNSKFCSVKCKRLAHGQLYRDKYRHQIRDKRYGLGDGEYAALLAAQNSGCAICGSDEWPGKDNTPHVDHDHVTGAVRGLLCGRCNTGVGQFEDDPARLRAAADYLEAHVST